MHSDKIAMIAKSVKSVTRPLVAHGAQLAARRFLD
jgi:hypothetical protein